jgi:transcriptional regulator with XRE-family HTH domain
MRACSAREGKAKTSNFSGYETSAKYPRSCGLALDAAGGQIWTPCPELPHAAHGTAGQARDRTELWKRVGAFVRARREELGLSQGDIIRVLGYKSRNAVSNIEVGIEGLPAKRAYAWADVLDVPRDAFFRFVTGDALRLDVPKAGREVRRGAPERRREARCSRPTGGSHRSTSAGCGSTRASSRCWRAPPRRRADRSPLPPEAREGAVAGPPAIERVALRARPALSERRERRRQAVA